MSARKSGQMSIRITDRALQDIAAIEEYSIENWGKRVADRYVDDIESALQRLAEHPELLREEPDFHGSLRFYRVNKHFLVCDVQVGAIYVLTVLHASMDIPNRLSEREPTLKIEVELLHKKLRRTRKSR